LLLIPFITLGVLFQRSKPCFTALVRSVATVLLGPPGSAASLLHGGCGVLGISVAGRTTTHTAKPQGPSIPHHVQHGASQANQPCRVCSASDHCRAVRTVSNADSIRQRSGETAQRTGVGFGGELLQSVPNETTEPLEQPTA
jgi:hypothetical protein